MNDELTERVIASPEVQKAMLNLITKAQEQERERCAQIVEARTLHSRMIHAACNGDSILPCEIAAAIRTVLKGVKK